MTIIATSPFYQAGALVAAGSTPLNYSAEIEADLVRRGVAAYSGANPERGGAVPAMLSAASGNTVLVGADGFAVGGTISSTRPNFEVSGTATETEAGRIKIPGGLMKANSALLITTLWQLDGADSKNLYMRAGVDATTAYSTSLRIGAYNGLTTQKGVGFTILLINDGSTGAQIAAPNGSSQPFGVASTTALIGVAVDTSLDWSIYLGAINSVIGDPVNKCILRSAIVELK